MDLKKTTLYVIKIIKTVSGFIFLLIGASGVFLVDDPFGMILGILLMLEAVILLPTFDYLCRISNKKISFFRKLALAFCTFFVSILVMVFCATNNVTHMVWFYLLLVTTIWIIIFMTSKEKYTLVKNVPKIKEDRIKNFWGKLCNYAVEKKSETKFFYQKLRESLISNKNEKLMAIEESRKEILDIWKNLNIESINIISKLIRESRGEYNKIFREKIPKINLSNLVIDFCIDLKNIETEVELDSLYSKEYYLNKINKLCPELVKYIKLRIKEELPYANKNKYLYFFKEYISVLTESIQNFSYIKFCKCLINEELEDARKEFFEQIDSGFRELLGYLADSFAISTCIAKIIFIESKIKTLDEASELYKIINNMTEQFNDATTIAQKTRPIYNEFYQAELGGIQDELSYQIAITILVNKMKSKKATCLNRETLINTETRKNVNMSDLDRYLRDEIKSVANQYRNLEIEQYILLKIASTIDLKNMNLLFESIEKMGEYIDLYYEQVDYNKKVDDKERYLKGDFEKEKKELGGKYTFDNIVTGAQFELYLVNLFKDLGYKVKHTGKAGDQGADLLIKKDNYVYAVQAKYYTGKLSNTPVQEIVGALKFYNANQGVVVTNSEFSSGAEELARANDIILIDGEKLKVLISHVFDEKQGEDILKKLQ